MGEIEQLLVATSYQITWCAESRFIDTQLSWPHGPFDWPRSVLRSLAWSPSKWAHLAVGMGLLWAQSKGQRDRLKKSLILGQTFLMEWSCSATLGLDAQSKHHGSAPSPLTWPSAIRMATSGPFARPQDLLLGELSKQLPKKGPLGSHLARTYVMNS